MIQRNFGRVARILYVTLFSLMAVIDYFFGGDPYNPVAGLLFPGKMVLTFPSGFLVLSGSLYVSYYMPSAVNSYLFLFGEWLAFFLVGYVQWFKLVPLIIRTIKGGDGHRPTLKTPFGKTLKILYVILSVSVLTLSFFLLEDNRAPEVFAVGMVALTIPSGFLVGLALQSAFWILMEFGLEPNPYVSLCITWLAFFSIGYVQWFRWTPQIVEAIKRRWATNL